MIKGNTVDGVESIEIVFVRCVVSVPRDDVERRVILFANKETADELGHDCKVDVLSVFISSHGIQKVTWVRETVGANRSEIGDLEVIVVHFQHIAARVTVGQIDLERDTARHDADFTGEDFEHTKFSAHVETTLLRD
jgi:hypothetical protein